MPLVSCQRASLPFLDNAFGFVKKTHKLMRFDAFTSNAAQLLNLYVKIHLFVVLS